MVVAYCGCSCGSHAFVGNFFFSFGPQLSSSGPFMVGFFLPTVLHAFKGLSCLRVVGKNRP